MALEFLGEYFWWSSFGMVELMILMGVLVFAFWLIFRRRKSFRFSHPNPGREPETALDILKKRYARGEITKEEFDRMKRDILS